MKIIASVEARMTSTRLPGKVLLKSQGKPMLLHQIERIKRSKYIDEIWIATSTNLKDKAIVDLARDLHVKWHRGSELDVLKRVVDTTKEANADIVVQLTGDCPLIDPEIIDQAIRVYNYNAFDYVSNSLVRSYPRGLDVSVMSAKILNLSLKNAKDAAHHEHIGLSIYENPKKFKLFNIFASPKLCRPDIRITLDTIEDFHLINEIYKNLYKRNKKFSASDIINFLDKHPNIKNINSHIQQKSVR
jgi:spore coat polysaccharide biosynthesis protein SpsF